MVKTWRKIIQVIQSGPFALGGKGLPVICYSLTGYLPKFCKVCLS